MKLKQSYRNPALLAAFLAAFLACGGSGPAPLETQPPTHTPSNILTPASGPAHAIAKMPTATPAAALLTRTATPTPTPTPTPTATPLPPTPISLVPASGGGNAAVRPAFPGVSNYLYQLQGIDLAAMGDTAYDLVIIDYSANGYESGEYSRHEIEALKSSPGGPKIVLAYMSIGEAEDYRFYWQDGWTTGNPKWLDQVNPDWAGNYKVRYWDPQWQAIVMEYTRRLVAAGFDGAYLDIIDAYEYFQERGRETAAQEMAGLVAAIGALARSGGASFYLFPQNAPELAGLIPEYLNSVDGIGQEDVYFGYNEDDQATPRDVTAALERDLEVFRNAGKLVLTVDYADSREHIDEAYARSQAKGYVPFVSVRSLDRLTVNPGHEPR